MSVARTKRHFQLLLINPSRSDAERHVVRKSRSLTPPNSLACIYALALDAAERQVLGPDVAIEITAIDETSTRVRVREIIAQFARHHGFGMVGLVGVRSDEFPRALEVARSLRGAGLPVVIGGFVSDRLAVLPDMQTDLKQALDMGCSVFVGSAENGRMDAVIRDAASGALQSIYDDVPTLSALESAPSPYLPTEALRRMIVHYAGFDAHHGCPFQCSFCVSTHVEGIKQRRSLVDDFEQSIRAHFRDGVPWFFITDENFARGQGWEQVFDRIIGLRERENIALNIAIQIDSLCHRIPNFVAKATRAGVRKVFIGPQNPELLPKEQQNKLAECRGMVLVWEEAGAIPYEGYILPSTAACNGAKQLSSEVPEFFCYAYASSRIRSAKPMASTPVTAPAR